MKNFFCKSVINCSKLNVEDNQKSNDHLKSCNLEEKEKREMVENIEKDVCMTIPNYVLIYHTPKK